LRAASGTEDAWHGSIVQLPDGRVTSHVVATPMAEPDDVAATYHGLGRIEMRSASFADFHAGSRRSPLPCRFWSDFAPASPYRYRTHLGLRPRYGNWRLTVTPPRGLVQLSASEGMSTPRCRPPTVTAPGLSWRELADRGAKCAAVELQYLYRPQALKRSAVSRYQAYPGSPRRWPRWPNSESGGRKRRFASSIEQSRQDTVDDPL